jgi:hypothetical protein
MGDEIKLCRCGCGEPAPIAAKTSKRDGHVKGQPCDFIQGHGRSRRTLQNILPPNPSGLCMCGCGQRTPIAKQTSTKKGYVQGEATRFLNGHAEGNGPNTVRYLSDGVSALILKGNNGNLLECFIDTKDYDIVKNYHWYAYKKRDQRVFYAYTTLANDRRESMHKLLLPGWDVVDHEDHNGLNNRRSNLRSATAAQNCYNRRKQNKDGITSRFKGVSWNKRAMKFVASVQFDGSKTYLGSFDSEEEAARVWNEAAKKLHGAFACLNTFPETIAA